MRHATFATIISAAVVSTIGCTTPPPNPTPPISSAKPNASEKVSPNASASAIASASTSKPPPSANSDDDDTMGLDNSAGEIDADTPAAPCDFSRNYRGTVGKATWSIVLSRKGSSLQGFVAYDGGSGDLNLNGSVGPDGTISLEESKDGKKGGQIEGKCAEATGIITGTWKQGATTQPFVLEPRNANGTPIFERRKIIGPVDDHDVACNWNVQSPAVFGLGDAEKAGRINAILKINFGGLNEADAERRVTQCSPGSDNHVMGWYSIEMNEQGLLAVLENGYVYLGPAAHGDFNAAATAINIDVPSGRRVPLTDVVISSKALRPVVKSCMKLVVDHIGSGDEWWFERDIQGVPSDKNGEPAEEGSKEFDPRSLVEPTFLFLPDGMAVLIRNQPTVTAFYELQGPVIQWGALVRAGILKKNSLISRLWANVKPLAPNEPACSRFFAPKWTAPVKRK